MTSNITTPSGSKHKRKSQKLWVAISLIAVIALIALAYIILRQTNQLSEKDFAAVEQKMSNAYADMAVTDVDRGKNCYYYEDSMGKTLKCSIEMVGYVPVKDSGDLPGILEKFEKQLKLINSTDLIWRTASDAGGPIKNASFGIKDSPLNMACQASVEMKEGKVSLGHGLPEKDLTGKVALVLTCGGGSREPYFEMQ